MTSSRMPENAEPISGDKSENVERGQTPGKESSEQFSGNELDELNLEENESVPEPGTDEPPAGGEQEGSKESAKEESQSVHPDDNLKRIGGKQERKKRLILFIFILLGLNILLGIGYFFIKEEKPPASSDQKGGLSHLEGGTVQINQLAIPKDQLLVFHSFVVPVKENKRFTYISLSISFNLPNKELRREMIEKKHQLRGIIYDILSAEIKKINEVPSFEKIKEVIIRGVNIALSAGRVNELYITEFLAV